MKFIPNYPGHETAAKLITLLNLANCQHLQLGLEQEPLNDMQNAKMGALMDAWMDK